MAWPARRRSVALIALIALLLPALAILQYRWLGELSGLEQHRALTNLRTATARFSTQFDAQLASLYAQVYAIAASESEGDDTTAIERAVRSLTPAGMVKTVHIIDRDAGGLFRTRELDATGRQVGAGEWPSWLGPAPSGTTPHDSGRDESALPVGLTRTLLDEVPAMVARHSRDGGLDRWVVAVLDLEQIARDRIPAMLLGCFEGGIPVTYDVLVVRDEAPDQVVYRSRAELQRADFVVTGTPMPVFAIHGTDLDPALARSLMPDAAGHRWRMLIQPQSGALEAAVGAARARNLAIGIGVLALLAVSVFLLVASMRRTERAAREQLELVARISHELRTPLATITCAGENLADSLVSTPTDARHYGQLIKREGRRLTKTLGDILLCCRLQARPDAVLNLQPTNVTGVIDRAVADTMLVANEDSVRVEKQVEPNLPVVLADAEALKMALKNLLINGIKYGGGHPVRISAKARRATSGQEVWIVVEDEGPGIPSDELSQIFEPFYRGRQARNLEIEGSGIGLSIVRQVVRSHGGRIRVTSLEEQGTRFTLQLPGLRPGATIPVDPAA